MVIRGPSHIHHPGSWLLMLLPLLLVFCATRTAAQVSMNDNLVQFSGVVVTSDSVKPIPFTHVIDQTTGYGTVADYNGYFSFVARKSDTVIFSAVGFKKGLFVIPDSISGNRYSVIHVMTSDTIFLSETVIYPWPTKEQFKREFLTMEVPDDYITIAMRNLERSNLKERAEMMPMDADANYNHYVDQIVSKNYYAGQVQPMKILDPFAWAEFIKAWKEGRFKRKD